MDIIHAAGRIFVTGAFTPSIPLETMASPFGNSDRVNKIVEEDVEVS